MKEMAGELKGVEIVEPIVTIRSRMQDTDRAALQALADAMLACQLVVITPRRRKGGLSGKAQVCGAGVRRRTGRLG